MKASKLIFIIILVILFLSIDRISARDFTHVFLSKGVYETCEDLWFKCLVLQDSTFRLSDKAHTAFVEIVNPNDSVVWKEKYPVVNGECDGQIYIGDDWETGEYRMYVNTRNTLGATDSIMFPKRLLIVRELPEVQDFLSTRSKEPDGLDYDTVFGQIKPLKVTVELDSADYHTRSTVKAKITVTDFNGNPIQAKIALTAYDRLYDYPLGNLSLLSQCYSWTNNIVKSDIDTKNVFLSDEPISGRLVAKKKTKELTPKGQFINVFDFSNTTGSLNIVETGEDGDFEIPSDIASALGWELLLKPVSGQKMKPELVFEDSFTSIDKIREHSEDRYFPDIHWQDSVSYNLDSVDFSGRRIVRLEEVVVNGHAGRYPKRNKLMGYLDSISTLHGNAWVCGCPAGHGTTFLNDYIPGYTHHPLGYGTPHKRSLPVKGKSYELIKYSGGTIYDHVVDIQYIEYPGPQYSEEELLRMNGLWKSKGFYPKHKFEIPTEEDWAYGLEDNRNTLVWNTADITNSQGKITIEIKTSDITSSFIIKGICWSLEGRNLGEFDVMFNVASSY